MILLGKAVLAEVPGARFVGEVKCSQAMYDELAAAGGTREMWKVGHSLIKARMKETGAQLAGEMSGHLFFAHRWLGFDDGIYVGRAACSSCCRAARARSPSSPPSCRSRSTRPSCASTVPTIASWRSSRR